MALLCTSSTAIAQGDAASARRIVDVIAELREQGITIIYSSELLNDEMYQREQREVDDPIDGLREALATYGLTVNAGPRDSWLIVRDPEFDPSQDEQQDPAPRPVFNVAPPTIEEVVVSASRYAISGDGGSSTARIDRLRVENTPTVGEDALRATHALPGVTTGGLSAQVNVRGGNTDEALLFLDGVQLIAPFHLKDFQSLFSSIDPEIIDSMTVFTGAFPARYGNRMSAVMDMRTIVPDDSRVFQAAASLFTTSLMSAGNSDSGRGHWLASARRGNLNLLINAAHSDLGSPEYQDVFAKFDYDLDSRWTLGVGLLALSDEIDLHEKTTAAANGNYEDSYLWLRADYEGEKLSASVLLSATDLVGNRSGEMSDADRVTGSLTDYREFDRQALRADWTWLWNERNLLDWGVELSRSKARYDHTSLRSEYLPIVVSPPVTSRLADVSSSTSLEGRRSAAYISYRARPVTKLTTELGLRWDEQDYVDESQLSPRLNILYEPSDRLRLRGSWGRYSQTQRLDEIQASDGLLDLFPAQESEHYVIGLEYLLSGGTAIRLEAYRKEIERLQPRHENLFDRVSLIPELLPDRVFVAPLSGEATGFELSADGERGRWRWWGSLSRARAYDEFADSRAARSWEEPWSLKAGAIRSGERWTTALTTSWHSGWPVSSLTLVNGELTAGPYNQERFGEFGTVDLRFSREIALDRSSLEIYFSVTNVFARKNACCVDYEVSFNGAGQPAALTVGTDDWLSIVPNAGIVWRFARGQR